MSFSFYRLPIYLIFLCIINSCAGLPDHPPAESLLVYSVEGDSLLERNSPVFIVENQDISYNRIGTIQVHTADQSENRVHVSPEKATVYAERRSWQAGGQVFTNLVYRIHFPEIPLRIVPFYLGAGKNIGLLVIVTLSPQNDRPLLYTTVHTCGCYLAFIPTSLLPEGAYPAAGWQKERQFVYGESLPSYLAYPDDSQIGSRFYILLRDGTHRIKDAWLGTREELDNYSHVYAELAPLDRLSHLRTPDGSETSFFETEGARKEYVVNSGKIWERLLISWWALDWRVGEDKRLGRDKNDGIVFYTSLKPWARNASDLRDFGAFLRYWGWRF